jgi:hypothetical protein
MGYYLFHIIFELGEMEVRHKEKNQKKAFLITAVVEPHI